MRWLLLAAVCASSVAYGDPELIATNLTFETGRARLTGESREALKPVATTMQQKPTVRIVIVGHGDSQIAKKRAEVVKWALVDAGVESDRIQTRVNPAPGKPVELEIQGAPKPRIEAPKAPAPRVEAVKVATPKAEAETTGWFGDDTRARRKAGVDLDLEMAAAKHVEVTIGGGSTSGFRDSAAPAAAMKPLELTIAPSTVTTTTTVERHETITRIRYFDIDRADVGTRAVIRAQRRAR